MSNTNNESNTNKFQTKETLDFKDSLTPNKSSVEISSNVKSYLVKNFYETKLLEFVNFLFQFDLSEEEIIDQTHLYLETVFKNSITRQNLSKSLNFQINFQKIEKINKNRYFNKIDFLKQPNLLGDYYVNGRVFGIRHGKTNKEGTLQKDDEPIMDNNYPIMDLLIGSLKNSGLGDNLYLYSDNRTLRIKQTTDYFMKKISFVKSQTDVATLDTTEKSFNEEYRFQLVGASTSRFIDVIESMGKSALDFGVICIIHSTNQKAFEKNKHSLAENGKMKNLGILQLDIGPKGIINYSNYSKIFRVTNDNIGYLSKNISEYFDQMNSDLFERQDFLYIKDLIYILTDNTYPIRNKQNYFNNLLFNNPNYILDMYNTVFYDNLDFALFTISHFIDNDELIEHILKKSFKNKIANNNANQIIICKLIDLFYNNHNLKYIRKLLILIFQNKELFNDMKHFYYKTPKIIKIFKIVKIIQVAKISILTGTVIVGALSSKYYMQQSDYGNNFFKDSTLKDDELNINPINFLFIDKSTNYHLNLSHIKTIDIQQLYYLMQLNLFSLDLSGIQYIDDQCARELSKFKGNVLNLNGLKSITYKQFEQITKFCDNSIGRIYLDGLESVDLVTMNKIISFKGENISLNGLKFNQDLSTLMRFSNVYKNNILSLNLDKYGFSDKFVKSIFDLIGTNHYLEYFQNLIKPDNKELYIQRVDYELKTLLLQSHNSSDFISSDKKNYIFEKVKFSNLVSKELYDYYLNNNFLLKSLLYKNLEVHLLNFITQNLGPLTSYMLVNQNILIYEINKYFEELFLSFLQTELTKEEFNMLIFDIYNKNSELNKTIIDCFQQETLNNYLLQMFVNLQKTSILQKLTDLAKLKISRIYDITTSNSIKLQYILSFLDNNDKHTLIIKSKESVSKLQEYLSNLNIELLVLYTENIDKIPDFPNTESLYINPKNFEVDGNVIDKYKKGNYDYVVYYPIGEYYQFGNIVNSTYKYFKSKNTHKKGIFLDLDNQYSLFPSMLKDSDVMRLSNLNVENLHLGSYYFNENTAKYFSKRFKKYNYVVNREIIMDLKSTSKDSPVYLMSRLPAGIIQQIQNVPNIIQSISNDFTISSIILNGFVDITNFNIFQPIKVADTKIEYSYNKSLFFSNLNAINLKAFTVFKDSGVNCFYTIFDEVNHQDSLTYTIQLIIDQDYNEDMLIANLNDFIKWIKISGLVVPTHSKIKFLPIFKGKQNDQVVKILTNENMLSKELTKKDSVEDGNSTGFNDNN